MTLQLAVLHHFKEYVPVVAVAVMTEILSVIMGG
jgi:hypothetical protein